jgi:serine phosphatase RsbU (regulator of sigma subunit)
MKGMRALRDSITKLWGLFSFAEKVAFVASLVGIVVFALSIAFAAVAYKADKEAYLFELQMLRARSAATNLRAELADMRARAQTIASGTSLPYAQTLGIARLPEHDEVFVVSSGKNNAILSRFDNGFVALFRNAKGDLLASPIAALLAAPHIPEEDGTIFAATAEGLLLVAAGKDTPTAQTLAERPSVRVALKSGLTESTTTFDAGEKRVVLAHTEIPNTNIVVFAEMPLTKLMAPFHAALRIWLIYGALVIIFGACLAFFSTRMIARPARLATEYLVRIAQGDYTSRPIYESKDEFHKIFAGIDFLTRNILSREKRLTLVGEGLKIILAQTAQWDTSMPAMELRKTCAEITATILKIYSPRAIGIWAPQGFEYFTTGDLASIAEPPPSRDGEKPVEFLVTARDKTPLMRIEVYGVRPSSIWPETLQTMAQFCEAVASYFDRRAASEEHLRKVQQDNEIAIAATIQTALVSFPDDVPHVEIARHYIPAETVGGDWTAAFYDERSGVLRFFMGDASGHGVGPSLVTAVVAGSAKTFHSLSRTNEHHNEFNADREALLLQNLAVELNSVVLDVGANKIGMTLLMGSLHCATGQLTLCNLGHTRAVAVGAEAQHARNLRSTTLHSYLGTEGFEPPRATSITLEPGQGLMMYTDGLVENYRSIVKRRLLNECGASVNSAAEMIHRVTSAYQKEAENRGQPDDDVAMLAIMWKG